MQYTWCSSAHNWCLLELSQTGDGVFIRIWQGLSADRPSQRYSLKFFTGIVAESTNELFEKGMRLAMGEFNERAEFSESVIELLDDGTITHWEGSLPEPKR